MKDADARLIAYGPSDDPVKTAAYRQFMSAIRFAYSAWSYAAVAGSAACMGAYACYSLRNLDEAAATLGCTEYAAVDKMQRVSDWLASRGAYGICAPVRTEDGHICVMNRSARQLVDAMKAYRDSYFTLLREQRRCEESSKTR